MRTKVLGWHMGCTQTAKDVRGGQGDMQTEGTILAGKVIP